MITVGYLSEGLSAMQCCNAILVAGCITVHKSVKPLIGHFTESIAAVAKAKLDAEE